MVLTLVFVALKSNVLHDVCDVPSWWCDVSWPVKCGAPCCAERFFVLSWLHQFSL